MMESLVFVGIWCQLLEIDCPKNIMHSYMLVHITERIQTKYEASNLS